MFRSELFLQLWVLVQNRVADADRERGDVPGWVMVTLMSAGIVVALLVAVKGSLVTAVTNAINSVISSSGS